MPPEIDLLERGMLPPLAAALLEGAAEDLLSPLAVWRGEAVSAMTGPSEFDRRSLAEGLTRANRSYGHPLAERLGERLADPESLVVVTGQQPGVLGGPLYTLTKAVAAVRLAERLESEGRRAVAVFWVHTEDHDFAEIARTAVLTPKGPLELSLGEDGSPLKPVGGRLLGGGIRDLLADIAEAVPGEPYHAWLQEVAGWYRPEATIGGAFCGLMAGLLGDRCPLLLDAELPEVKQAQAPWLESLVTSREEIAEELDVRTRRVAGRGFKPQVRFQPDAAPLFLIDHGERRRIIWEQNGYRLRGQEAAAIRPIERLIDLAQSEPERLSAGVLARPAIQDAILGTSVQLLGPGELAYMVQAAGTHAVLGVAPPRVALRPQILVLTARQLGWLEASGVELEELLGGEEELDRALARELGGDFVAPVRERIEQQLDELEAPTEALDRGLAKPLGKTRQQVIRALDTFSNKVAGALANRDQIQRRRLQELRSVCRPLGGSQERVISTAHFPGRLGEDFLAALWGLDLAPDRLQTIVPLAGRGRADVDGQADSRAAATEGEEE